MRAVILEIVRDAGFDSALPLAARFNGAGRGAGAQPVGGFLRQSQRQSPCRVGRDQLRKQRRPQADQIANQA